MAASACIYPHRTRRRDEPPPPRPLDAVNRQQMLEKMSMILRVCLMIVRELGFALLSRHVYFILTQATENRESCLMHQEPPRVNPDSVYIPVKKKPLKTRWRRPCIGGPCIAAGICVCLCWLRIKVHAYCCIYRIVSAFSGESPVHPAGLCDRGGGGHVMMAGRQSSYNTQRGAVICVVS